MTAHKDTDEVEIQYSSISNITFRGKRSIGITWGEWREMSSEERDQALTDFIFDLVDVGVVDDEGDGQYGECSACTEGIQVDDDIRADGLGGWIHARESCETSVEWALSGQASVPPQQNRVRPASACMPGECL